MQLSVSLSLGLLLLRGVVLWCWASVEQGFASLLLMSHLTTQRESGFWEQKLKSAINFAREKITKLMSNYTFVCKLLRILYSMFNYTSLCLSYTYFVKYV